MSFGCFSWCPLLMHRKSKIKVSELAIVSTTKEYTSVEDLIMKINSKAKLSENPEEVIPTTTKYITATGKQALILLKSAATLIPVPLIQEAIGVALKIIEVCEKISVVEEKVKDLQDRVCHLMVVIVDNVTSENEEGSDEIIVKAAKGIERDIKDLLRTLRSINEELDKITAQGPWLLGIYSDLNTSAVDGCLDRLSTALEKFKLANDLRDSNLLQELQTRLAKIQNLAQHLANKVDVVHEEVKNIKQILTETGRSATLRSSETVVQQMPLKPGVFHGRDGIIEEITQLLMKEETSRICILGSGGMGKTSVSLAVVEQPLIKARFLPENRVWVPCVEATSATLLLEILYVQLQVPGNKQVTIERIISLLNTSTQPHLILLDNFETPYNTPGRIQKQVEDILRQLAMLSHVAILVTMRGKYPPCDEAIKWQSKNIRPTDEAACLRIYHNIYPDSENDRDVGRLLRVLGHMPFAVTLMARLAKEGRSTAEELLFSWSAYGPDIIPDHHEQSMNRSISLSVDSYLMKQNPQALLLLKILSYLPAGTTKATLRWWAPALHLAMVPSAIATLSKAGLLVEDDRQDCDSPVLSVLPVVQSFMQQHGRIEEEIRHNIQSSCCQYVLDHACRKDDLAFPIKSKALESEDVNIQAILYGPTSAQHSIMLSDRAIEALIAFSWYRCDTKPNLEIAKHAVTMSKTFGSRRYMASTLWCLGTTYGSLGEHYAAYDYLHAAYQLFSALLPGDSELQRFCCRSGIALAVAARATFEDIDKAVSLARDIEKQCASFSDDLVHARSLIVLGSALRHSGWVLGNSGHLQEALLHLDRAKPKLVGTIHISDACSSIALVHYYENRLPEALDAVKEAWMYAESSNSLADQAQISLVFGMILFSANRDTEAWKYIEISLMKNSNLGNRLDSATALEYMGYGYLRRGDYVNAYGAYEAAKENYHGTGDEEADGTTCKDNMVRIKDKQRNPDLNVGFERPRADKDWSSLFYLPVKT